MPTFEFKVKIEAENNEEGRKVLTAMFDIMKTIRNETSTGEFIEFAGKLRAKPSLIHKAKMFI